ncbi:hypothetical protein NUU61_003722 [Penicillium alfredii]|uniref:Uncharacterized protein n=1 Tax=Penicillium alfredii TaxID=1506179 RepID=A0A9W9FJV9_9EURO|nr:uncharacterized protein NUU61_003722 [Penicillium alfredii]KAJ5101500.1 hypothetical protein NUU61_003722 [Penicillium alfredii]
MPYQPQLLKSPVHPIALRPSHLLSPAPDRVTNTPTTLSITRETSGRDFMIHLIHTHEPLSSPRRRSILFTVAGKIPSASLQRQIRDASGLPLLDLKRAKWRRQWSVTLPGGAGAELLFAEMPWIGMKMDVHCLNALAGVRPEEPQYQNPHEPEPPPPYSAAATNNNHSNEQRRTDASRNQPQAPSYYNSTPSSGDSSQNQSGTTRPNTKEPALAPRSLPSPPQGSGSDSPPDPKIELKVVPQSGTITAVMMGDRKVVHIRQDNVMGRTTTSKAQWELQVAEGVDLLLAVSITLILSEFVPQS